MNMRQQEHREIAPNDLPDHANMMLAEACGFHCELRNDCVLILEEFLGAEQLSVREVGSPSWFFCPTRFLVHAMHALETWTAEPSLSFEIARHFSALKGCYWVCEIEGYAEQESPTRCGAICKAIIAAQAVEDSRER